MSFRLLFSAALGAMALSAPGNDLAEDGAAYEVQVLPTFENASVYWNAPGEGFRAEYRQGAGEWMPAPPLVRTENDPVWRCSLLALQENTPYEVRIKGAAGVAATATFRTLDSRPPVGETVVVGPGPFTFSGRGTADAWIRLVADGPLDAGQAQEAALELHGASYILIEGLTIRGGRRHGIWLDGCDHVIVRDCDISGFGRHGVLMFQSENAEGRFFDHDGNVVTHDAGIYLGQTSNVLIERNYVHDSRTRSVSWATAHPTGSAAILMDTLQGRTVIRHNDLIGSLLHPYDDVILSINNGDPDGGPARDADIYGNLLMGSNDDAVELDGGQRNARFYDNLCLATLCGVSTAPCFYGPTYIFNNLMLEGGDETGRVLYAIKNIFSKPGQGTVFAVGNTLRYAVSIGRFKVTDEEGSRIIAQDNVMEAVSSLYQDGLMASDSVPGRNLLWSPTAAVREEARALLQAYPGISDPLFAAPRYVHAAAGDFRLRPDGAPAAQSPAGFPARVHMGIDSAMMPKRPGPLRLERTFVALCRAEREHQLTATLEGAQPLAYRVLKNADFDWFTVRPSSGALEPGVPVDFQVSYVPRTHSTPGAKGAFIIKLSDGTSRPVIVTAAAEDPFIPRVQEPRIAAVIEAEAILPIPRAPTRAGVASGGAAVLLAAGDQLAFEFLVTRENDYYIAARCRAADQSLSALGTVQLNDEPVRDFRLPLTQDFSCASLFRFPDNPNKSFHPQRLGVGPQRIVFKTETPIEVDALYVVTSPNALYRRGYDPLPLK
ncbi:MAG: right-handed parallel beta-helix repeat-containing protein [Candidatus Marinimicrobia bacterium]|nr:right-handed parallel beta-helix repeat-containing protein [Candidatus Neomarinimicrobiota bacterium]